MSKENKKAALFYIYQLLLSHSDYQNPLTHTEISRLLKEHYGTVIERKAVGRDIAILKDAGIPIEVTKKGSYISEKILSDQEISIICDALQTTNRLTPARAEDLISKISELGSIRHAAPRTVCFNLDNINTEEYIPVFYDMDRISRAISDNTKISFDISRFGLNKRLHRYASVIVSPYELLIHNGRYFLMAFDDGKQDIMFYDLERITNIRQASEMAIPLKSIPIFKNGIDHSLIGHTDTELFIDVPSIHEFILSEKQLDDYMKRLNGYPGLNIVKENDRIRMTVMIGEKTLAYIQSVITISP